MKRIIGIFINLGVFMLAIVIAFIFAEFIIRFLYKDNMILFPRYHTEAQYGQFTIRKMRPNSEFWHTSPSGSWKFTINKQGFRNYKDFEYDKPKGIIRIISLGDSQTEGYEVRQDYTFSAIVEKYLLNQGYPVEVMNTGVSGFGTAEELVFLENEGIKYHPDFVILSFFANDFQDNLTAGLFNLEKDGSLVIQKKEHIPGVNIQDVIYSLPFTKWMSENSYFYSLLFNNIWDYYKSRLNKTAFNQVTEYAIPTQEISSNYGVALTTALWKRMYNFCHKNDIKLIVVDIPMLEKGNRIESSLSHSLLSTIQNYSDAYVIGDSLLADYIGVVDIHVPYGQQHISEFVHTLIGVAIAKKIVSLLGMKPT